MDTTKYPLHKVTTEQWLQMRNELKQEIIREARQEKLEIIKEVLIRVDMLNEIKSKGKDVDRYLLLHYPYVVADYLYRLNNNSEEVKPISNESI
jgi:pyruvate formate-lyase activating enzyme-like uncharacterized protein